jgi:hypothetical protein
MGIDEPGTRRIGRAEDERAARLYPFPPKLILIDQAMERPGRLGDWRRLPDRPLGIELAQALVGGDEAGVVLDCSRIDEAVDRIAVEVLGIE